MATSVSIFGFSVLFLSEIVWVSNGLECVTCFNALHPVLCKSIGTCSANQKHCGTHKFLNIDGDIRYHLGCFNSDTCTGKVNPVFIGRRKRSAGETGCCSTDLCNKDPEHVGQTIGVEHTDHTKDVGQSVNVDFTSTTQTNVLTKVLTASSSSCTDHPDCVFLIKHNFYICDDVELSVSLCPNVCRKC